MRGENEAVLVLAHLDGRFIPACAGKTLGLELVDAVVDRFIPACAGKTERPDHEDVVLDGSSPHARGKRLAL